MTMAGYSPQLDTRPRPDQHHQGGADQEFVGDRVQHTTEVGLLAARAREVAVEVIGDRRGAEQHAGSQIGRRHVQGDQHHQQRDCGDPR